MKTFRASLIAATAAVTFAGLGIAPAFADNPDPYTYDYSWNSARAQTCMVQQPVYDKAGHQIGEHTVNVCSK
jgi:hypothetical protein